MRKRRYKSFEVLYTNYITISKIIVLLRKQRAVDFKAKNEARYAWLQDICDADGNPEGIISSCDLKIFFFLFFFETKFFILLFKGSPNYDPRTLYVPKSVKFTPFEKQYW